jgi:hypothetical protein
LNIELWAKTTCYGNPDDCEETIDWVARLAFEYHNDLEFLSGMRVVLFNQTDLGFLNANRTYGAALTIEDWQKRLTE